MKFALFIITKLFDYLYIGLVLLNFLYILQPCREELYGYRKQTEGASCLKGIDYPLFFACTFIPIHVLHKG